MQFCFGFAWLPLHVILLCDCFKKGPLVSTIFKIHDCSKTSRFIFQIYQDVSWLCSHCIKMFLHFEFWLVWMCCMTVLSLVHICPEWLLSCGLFALDWKCPHYLKLLLLFKLILLCFFSLLVTLDLKALYMLLVKVDDESFVLAGRGSYNIEFCFLCHALRVFWNIFCYFIKLWY